MADINGYDTFLPQNLAYAAQLETPQPYATNLTPAATFFYQMEGTDAVTTAVASWVVQGAPDFSATFFPGGLTLPLRFVKITAQWPAP